MFNYSEALTLLAHVGSPALQVVHILECASTDPGRPPKTPYKQHPIIKSHPLIVFQNCFHDIAHKVIQTEGLIEAFHLFGFYQELAPGNLADMITRSSPLAIRAGGWALPLPGGCSWWGSKSSQFHRCEKHIPCIPSFWQPSWEYWKATSIQHTPLENTGGLSVFSWGLSPVTVGGRQPWNNWLFPKIIVSPPKPFGGRKIHFSCAATPTGSRLWGHPGLMQGWESACWGVLGISSLENRKVGSIWQICVSWFLILELTAG